MPNQVGENGIGTLTGVHSTDYDKMAPAYALITSIISMGGNARSQRVFLEYLPPQARVLSVGCGSIGFNAELARSRANLTFLDLSPRMIAYTRKNLSAAGVSAGVEFVCADVMRYNPSEAFDVVLANFFLNTFAWDDCRKVMAHLVGLLKPDGRLCIADEAPGEKRSTRILQKAFRPVLTWLHHVWADHPMHPIYDYRGFLESLGMEMVARKRDASDYLVSTVYRKR